MPSEVLLLGLLFLFSSRKAAASSSTAQSAAASSAASVDGAALIARANQLTARKWIPLLVQQDVPQQLAEAIARWIGIESSGDPLAVSPSGERGLAQCSATTALTEGVYSQAEWDSLINPSTTNEEHARLAYKLVNWCWNRAKAHLQNPPSTMVDGLWYAKLYHQRPVDVRDGHLHGPAVPMARELGTRWANDAQKSHYLRAANVVAFGVFNVI